MICLTLLQALHVYLSSKSAITDLVSTRIYRGQRPQGVTGTPSITYVKVSGQDELYQTGVSTLGEVRVEVSCWGATPASAEAVRDAIRNVCQRYSGTITSGEESIVIVLMRLTNDGEEYDPPEDGGKVGEFVTIVDLHIWWRPTVPTG